MTEDSKREEMSLKELILSFRTWLKYIFSKWYILLLAGLIGGMTGFFYAQSKKDVYRAVTTFVLESGESNGGLNQYAGIASMVGVDLGSSSTGIFQGDNLFEFYRSRKMLESTLLKPSLIDSSKLLIDRYLTLEKNMRHNQQVVDFGRTYTGLEKRKRDSVINNVIGEIIKKNLKVDKLDKKLSIIKVEIKAYDEAFAKEFNTALVKEVNDFYRITKTRKAQQNIEIIQSQVDSIRRVMHGSIQAVASIADATPNLNPTRQAQRIVPTQRSQFSTETNKAILNQLVQNLELAKMTLLKESPLIQIIDEPTFPLEKNSVSKKLFFLIGFLFLVAVAVSMLTVLRFYKSTMHDFER